MVDGFRDSSFESSAFVFFLSRRDIRIVTLVSDERISMVDLSMIYSV
jgi:hypothetical protein